MLIEEIHNFCYEEQRSGFFLGSLLTLHSNILLKILAKFSFDSWPRYWLPRLLSLTYSLTSFVLKLLYFLSTSFLAHGSFIKVVQLFKSFPTGYSFTLFGGFFHSYGAWGSKSTILVFFLVAEAVCTPIFGYMCFFQFLAQNGKIWIFCIRVALILGNSFHPDLSRISFLNSLDCKAS